MREAHLRARMARLRQIIAEAVPIEPQWVEATAPTRRHYPTIAALSSPDDTENARKIRNINRIALSYNGVTELQRIMDLHGTCSIALLDDLVLDEVHMRFVKLESFFLEGFRCPPTPPNR